MPQNSYSKLKLETFFVELDAVDEASGRETLTDALLELGFDARVQESADETHWRVGVALPDPQLQGRYGIEVFPPESQPTAPRQAWTWAHAIAANLPDDSSAQPTFEGDIPLTDGDEALEESSSGGGGPGDPAPNDVRWHHSRIRLAEAHAKLKSQKIEPGQNVIIGHPDTGYTKHRDISPTLDLSRELNLLEKGKTAFDPQKGGTLEQPGHGTATSSMAVAQDGVTVKRPNGETVDIMGIAPAAKIAPIRVTETVIILGWQRRLAQAIEHAVDKGCKVISMSLGGIGGRRLNRAIAYAEKHGVIVVAAAGNNVGFVVAPATHPLTVACAASDFEDKPWSGSSKGSAVTITAPGHNVWVAGWNGNNQIARPGSGTSHATATVAGAAAMWLSAHGKKLAGHEASVPRLFRAALRKTAKKVAALPSGQFGAGLLDCEKLIATDPLLDESTQESVSPVANADLPALNSLLSQGAATESSMTNSATAAAVSRDLDAGTIAELAFHLTVDPQLRQQWNTTVRPATESAVPMDLERQKSKQFSPRLLTHLRRAERIAGDLPASSADSGVLVNAEQEVQAVQNNGQNSVEVQIRLNLKITVEVAK